MRKERVEGCGCLALLLIDFRGEGVQCITRCCNNASSDYKGHIIRWKVMKQEREKERGKIKKMKEIGSKKENEEVVLSLTDSRKRFKVPPLLFHFH